MLTVTASPRPVTVGGLPCQHLDAGPSVKVLPLPKLSIEELCHLVKDIVYGPALTES